MLLHTASMIDGLDIPHYEATILFDLALIDIETGCLAEAEVRLGESAAMAMDLGDVPLAAEILIGFAHLKAVRGEPAAAARILGASRALCDGMSFVPDYPASAIRASAARAAQAELGADAAAQAETAGRALSMNQAMELARARH